VQLSIKPLLLAGDRKALVLGTGGASRAVVYSLKSLGFEVFRVSRSEKGAEHTYSGLSRHLMDSCTVIVNTTPLGSSQFPGEKPDLPYEYLDSRHLLYDLIYNPERTPFLIEGIARGCRVKNGLEMLELQAEAAWDFWTNPNAESSG
jgi:shikimate dehydrogenase